MPAKKIQHKIHLDYKILAEKVEAHRVLGQSIVCTIGSWDMLHIGHMRYLNKAKEQGDILVVLVDSDAGIKKYKKNPLRPIIPQEERMEMLAYQDCIDYVSLADDVDQQGNWKYGLIKLIKPDVFVAVTDSYPAQQIQEIKRYCQKVVQFPRQAQKTSSSKIIEKVVKGHLEEMMSGFNKR